MDDKNKYIKFYEDYQNNQIVPVKSISTAGKSKLIQEYNKSSNKQNHKKIEHVICYPDQKLTEAFPYNLDDQKHDIFDGKIHYYILSEIEEFENSIPHSELVIMQYNKEAKKIDVVVPTLYTNFDYRDLPNEVFNVKMNGIKIQADGFSCFALAFSLAKRMTEDEAKKLLSGEIKYTEGMAKYAQASSKEVVENVPIIHSKKEGSENGMIESIEYRKKYQTGQLPSGKTFNERLKMKREKLVDYLEKV